MKITCWGARGSIPVSGKEYVKFGGDTTCIEVRSKDNDIIIIDAGTGMRMLGNKLLAEEKRPLNILFTHVHWDHLMGFPFFTPLYEGNEDQHVRLSLCPGVHKSYSFKIHDRPLLSRGLHQAEIFSHEVCEETFDIGPIHITNIQLNHPNQGMGYKNRSLPCFAAQPGMEIIF